jgi:hypothetical protein
MESAPTEIHSAIRWAQENLDEVEVVELISSFQEMFEAIAALER